MTDALILTATLDPATQFALDTLRRRYFPPERNFLSAHLTLFHRLPADRCDAVARHVGAVALAHPPLAGILGAPFGLGGGVAYAIECRGLLAVRAELAEPFVERLGRQDIAWGRPHVTVQNKVAPDAARALLRALEASYVPQALTVTGFALHRYLGGPWRRLAEWSLAGNRPEPGA